MANFVVLEPAFTTLVSECQSLLEKAEGGSRSPMRLLVHSSERAKWLAERIEQTTPFTEFLTALPTPPDEAVADYVTGDSTAKARFLKSVGFYHDIVDRVPPSLDRILQRWNRQRRGSRRLYLLTGVSVEEPGAAFNGARIYRMAEPELEEFFNNRARRGFDTPFDLAPLIGGTFLDLDTELVSLEDFYMGPDRSDPWLTYLNLLGPHLVGVGATYERADFESFGFDLLSDTTKLEYSARLQDTAPRIVSAELQARLQRFEDGRTASTSHRVTTAMKCFGRACRALSEAYPGDSEKPLPFGYVDHVSDTPLERGAREWGVVDLTTAMEAIFLDESRGQKTGRLVARAAALLSTSDSEMASLRDRIEEAYNVRSRLVHGDTVVSLATLVETTPFLRGCARRSLVALLHMSGDQNRIVAGASNADVRAENRALVPR